MKRKIRRLPLFANLFALAFARPSRLPGQLVIQITNHCNGSCPQCGMRREAEIRRVKLPAAAPMGICLPQAERPRDWIS